MTRPSTRPPRFIEADAAVLVGPNEPLRVVPVEIPAPGPGQVLVQVAYSGVCASQVLEARGRRGQDPYIPHTLGHEGSGRVVAVGAGVRKVGAGDDVVLSWVKGGGVDAGGTKYRSSLGEINSGPVSTFMRFTLASESRVTRVPPALPLGIAALLGCAVLTGAGIVRRALGVREGSSLAVFGIGGIGASAVLMASHVPAAEIIAVDVRDEKLQWATKLGATHTIDVTETDPVARIRELTGGVGSDFAVECSGNAAAMEAAFSAVHDVGGHCVLAGNLPLGGSISIDPFALIRGRRLSGTWGGGSIPDEDIPYYADLQIRDVVDFGVLSTHEYRLEDINDALDDLERGGVGRALVRM